MELPKNITQIGEADKHCRVYVEDYVVSYIKQMNGMAQNKDIAIALYGRRTTENGLSVRLWFGETEFSAKTDTAPVPGTGAGDREVAEEVFSGNDIFRISDPEWRDGGRLPDL